VPVDTTIPLELRATLNSRTAYAGEAVYCDTIYPVVVKNRVVIPVGSYVKGRVTQVTRPGHVKGKAQLGLRFDEITLPSGVTKPLRATLSGFGGSGNEGFKPKEGKIQGEGSKGKDAEVIAISAGEGAGIGSVAGISSGHSGAGAAIGGAAGAVGGLVYVLATRGKEVVLPQGTSLELQLAAPLSYYSDEIGSTSTGSGGPALGRRDPGPGM
jgi:type IV secretion system protein VirB10